MPENPYKSPEAEDESLAKKPPQKEPAFSFGCVMYSLTFVIVCIIALLVALDLAVGSLWLD